MTKLLELQKAVANRNFEHDAIDEDLEFVEDQFDAFHKYFNAVYEDICAGETAKVLLSSGRWTTEQYQDKIVSLDQNRRMAHDRAVDACKILNRMCDMHQVEHICPDKYDRATVADYVGNVMQEYYQEGLSKQLELKSHTKSAVREKAEYLYAGKYWVDISSAYGCITTGFICTGTGPTADIYQGEIFIEPDDFSRKIKAEKLDEYVENSYILKELAEYVKDNTEKLLEGKLNNSKKASE